MLASITSSLAGAGTHLSQSQQHRELRDSLCINLVPKAQSLHTPILVLLVHESSRIWRITSCCAETGVQHPGLSESERRDQQPSLTALTLAPSTHCSTSRASHSKTADTKGIMAQRISEFFLSTIGPGAWIRPLRDYTCSSFQNHL